MKTYKITYTCPHCPNECGYSKDREANELIYASSKTDAREYFQAYKGCRWKKITSIEVDEDC